MAVRLCHPLVQKVPGFGLLLWCIRKRIRLSSLAVSGMKKVYRSWWVWFAWLVCGMVYVHVVLLVNLRTNRASLFDFERELERIGRKIESISESGGIAMAIIRWFAVR